jgi:hypothetical protein
MDADFDMVDGERETGTDDIDGSRAVVLPLVSPTPAGAAAEAVAGDDAVASGKSGWLGGVAIMLARPDAPLTLFASLRTAEELTMVDVELVVPANDSVVRSRTLTQLSAQQLSDACGC